MKVLLLSNKVPFPAVDGSSIAMRSMAEGLRQNGAALRIMALNTLKHFRSQAEIEATKPADIELEIFNANTNLSLPGLLANLWEGSAYHVSRFYQSSFSQGLKKNLQAHNFDIVQVEGLAMAVYLPLVRQYSRAKVVLRAHNLEWQIWQRHVQHEKNLLKKYYLGLQVKRLAKFEEETFEAVDGIIFITAMDKNAYEQNGGRNTATAIPCGLNPEEYEALGTKPDYDLSYLASFDWLPNRQGLEWFMEGVWPRIRKKKPRAQLALGGRDMPRSFKKYQKQGVHLFEEIENSRKFIQRGKVAIVPLLAGSGMRIKIIENMALGCAMVSTPIGAEGIELDNGQNIILAQSEEDFARAVSKLLDDSNLREKMGRAARETIAKHYTNRVLGQKTLDFYRQL